jgi:hypothetical protein
MGFLAIGPTVPNQFTICTKLEVRLIFVTLRASIFGNVDVIARHSEKIDNTALQRSSSPVGRSNWISYLPACNYTCTTFPCRQILLSCGKQSAYRICEEGIDITFTGLGQRLYLVGDKKSGEREQQTYCDGVTVIPLLEQRGIDMYRTHEKSTSRTCYSNPSCH